MVGDGVGLLEGEHFAKSLLCTYLQRKSHFRTSNAKSITLSIAASVHLENDSPVAHDGPALITQTAQRTMFASTVYHRFLPHAR